MKKLLSKYFFSGLFTLLPILITIWLIWFLFNYVDGFLLSIFSPILGFKFPGLGLISLFILSSTIGYLTTYIFGKKILGFGEKLLTKVPLINAVYSSVKQINDMLFLQKETRAFKRACAVEYPRKGIYSIGFITGEGLHEIKEHTHKKYVNIFIPTSPTPATGFMIAVQEEEIILLDISIEDAIKLIVSGGVLTPPHKTKT
ncbi:MAG: DUF502 domain-containing protein [bacterium]